VYFLGALLFVLVFGFVGPSLALSEALRPPQGGLLERSGGQGRRGTRRHALLQLSARFPLPPRAGGA
jgi:hypothetical protein